MVPTLSSVVRALGPPPGGAVWSQLCKQVCATSKWTLEVQICQLQSQLRSSAEHGVWTNTYTQTCTPNEAVFPHSTSGRETHLIRRSRRLSGTADGMHIEAAAGAVCDVWIPSQVRTHRCLHLLLLSLKQGLLSRLETFTCKNSIIHTGSCSYDGLQCMNMSLCCV